MKNIDEEMREFDMLAQIWKPNGPNIVLERQFPFSENGKKRQNMPFHIPFPVVKACVN
jgi:hypothetical protein